MKTAVLSLGLVLAWAASPVLAQAPALRAALSATRIEAQGVVRVTYTVEGGSGRDFSFPRVDGLVVVSGPNQESSTRIFNGQVERTQRFSVDLIGIKLGRHTIPPASVTIDGRRVAAEPLEVEVAAPANDARGGADPAGAEVAFRIRAPARPVYVGERFRIDGELLNRVEVYTYRMLTAPEFGSLKVDQLRTFDSYGRPLELGGVTYNAQRIYAVDAYAAQPGRVTIRQPAMVVNVVVGGRGLGGGFFFGPQTRPVNVGGEEATVEVRPLPRPAPADFSGAVGRWRFAGEFEGAPATLSTSDALRFRLRAEGHGDASRLAAPAIAWPEGWRVYPVEEGRETTVETDTGIVATREFVYTVVPERPGRYALAPRVSWFDTEAEAYLAYVADTLAVEVDGPAVASPLAGAGPADASDDLVYRGRPRVIRGFWVAQPWYWALLALAPLGLVAGWVMGVLRKRRGERPAASPATAAVDAQERMRAARAAVDEPARFYEALTQALDAVAAEGLGLGRAERTEGAIRAAFRARAGEAGAGLAEAYLAARDLAERGRFGGGADREARVRALTELERAVGGVRAASG